MKLERDNTGSLKAWGASARRPSPRQPFMGQLLALLGRAGFKGGPGAGLHRKAQDELVYVAISPAKQGRWVVRRAEAP